MTKPRPLCRFCGGPIAKYTTRVWFGENVDFYKNSPDRALHRAEKPTSRADAQRYVNEEIASVQWSTLTKDGEPLPWDQQFIRSVTLWDGKSYVDDFFCNGDHSRRFGYMVAQIFDQEGRHTKAYNEALAKQQGRTAA